MEKRKTKHLISGQDKLKLVRFYLLLNEIDLEHKVSDKYSWSDANSKPVLKSEINNQEQSKNLVTRDDSVEAILKRVRKRTRAKKRVL